MNYLTVISIPIIVGVIALDNEIVGLFKAGNEAIWPLCLSILALFFIFVNFPIGSLLNACDRQRQNLVFMIIVTIASVALNFILIPKLQAAGASITVLITNALMFALGMWETNKVIDYKPKKNLIALGKTLLAALVMGIIVYYGKHYVPVIIATIAGGLLYFFFLYLVGGFQKEDIKSIFASFKRS
jgi:O-antigen/teichoic acid export membrane protein